MYKKLLFLLMLVCTVSVNAQWVQLYGLTGWGANVTCLVNSGKNIFAGTLGGVFLSTNGTTWTPVNTGLGLNTPVVSFAVSPNRTGGANLFIGTYPSDVFLSTDNGTSWTEVANSGLTEDTVALSLAVSSNETGGTNLFAGTGQNNEFYIGSRGEGVYLSTNNGTSWTSINTGLTNPSVTALAVSSNETGGTNLFAGTNGGVFLSTNNGTSWTAINTGLTNPNVTAFAVSSNETGGTNLFAGTNGGVFLSTNNGTNWTAVNTGLGADTIIVSFAVSPNGTGGANLFVGTSPDGVFLSTNNGTSWTSVNAGLGSKNLLVTSLLVNGTNLFAATLGSCVWVRPLSQMITGVKEKQNNLPTNFSLQQNYPNPFNPSTVINYSIPKTSLVTIKVYNVLGKEMATLVNEEKIAGNYSVQFSGSKLSSEIYFYRMQAGDFVQTKKLLLLK